MAPLHDFPKDVELLLQYTMSPEFRETMFRAAMMYAYSLPYHDLPTLLQLHRTSFVASSNGQGLWSQVLLTIRICVCL